jgi:hypothetical protein
LIDFLEGAETIDQFLKLYPSIAPQQVLTVLDQTVNVKPLVP